MLILLIRLLFYLNNENGGTVVNRAAAHFAFKRICAHGASPAVPRVLLPLSHCHHRPPLVFRLINRQITGIAGGHCFAGVKCLK